MPSENNWNKKFALFACGLTHMLSLRLAVSTASFCAVRFHIEPSLFALLITRTVNGAIMGKVWGNWLGVIMVTFTGKIPKLTSVTVEDGKADNAAEILKQKFKYKIMSIVSANWFFLLTLCFKLTFFCHSEVGHMTGFYWAFILSSFSPKLSQAICLDISIHETNYYMAGYNVSGIFVSLIKILLLAVIREQCDKNSVVGTRSVKTSTHYRVCIGMIIITIIVTSTICTWWTAMAADVKKLDLKGVKNDAETIYHYVSVLGEKWVKVSDATCLKNELYELVNTIKSGTVTPNSTNNELVTAIKALAEKKVTLKKTEQATFDFSHATVSTSGDVNKSNNNISIRVGKVQWKPATNGQWSIDSSGIDTLKLAEDLKTHLNDLIPEKISDVSLSSEPGHVKTGSLKDMTITITVKPEHMEDVFRRLQTSANTVAVTRSNNQLAAGIRKLGTVNAYNWFGNNRSSTMATVDFSEATVAKAGVEPRGTNIIVIAVKHVKTQGNENWVTAGSNGTEKIRNELQVFLKKQLGDETFILPHVYAYKKTSFSWHLVLKLGGSTYRDRALIQLHTAVQTLAPVKVDDQNNSLTAVFKKLRPNKRVTLMTSEQATFDFSNSTVSVTGDVNKTSNRQIAIRVNGVKWTTRSNALRSISIDGNDTLKLAEDLKTHLNDLIPEKISDVSLSSESVYVKSPESVHRITISLSLVKPEHMEDVFRRLQTSASTVAVTRSNNQLAAGIHALKSNETVNLLRSSTMATVDFSEATVKTLGGSGGIWTIAVSDVTSSQSGTIVTGTHTDKLKNVLKTKLGELLTGFISSVSLSGTVSSSCTLTLFVTVGTRGSVRTWIDDVKGQGFASLGLTTVQGQVCAYWASAIGLGVGILLGSSVGLCIGSFRGAKFSGITVGALLGPTIGFIAGLCVTSAHDLKEKMNETLMDKLKFREELLKEAMEVFKNKTDMKDLPTLSAMQRWASHNVDGKPWVNEHNNLWAQTLRTLTLFKATRVSPKGRSDVALNLSDARVQPSTRSIVAGSAPNTIDITVEGVWGAKKDYTLSKGNHGEDKIKNVMQTMFNTQLGEGVVTVQSVTGHGIGNAMKFTVTLDNTNNTWAQALRRVNGGKVTVGRGVLNLLQSKVDIGSVTRRADTITLTVTLGNAENKWLESLQSMNGGKIDYSGGTWDFSTSTLGDISLSSTMGQSEGQIIIPVNVKGAQLVQSLKQGEEEKIKIVFQNLLNNKAGYGKVVVHTLQVTPGHDNITIRVSVSDVQATDKVLFDLKNESLQALRSVNGGKVAYVGGQWDFAQAYVDLHSVKEEKRSPGRQFDITLKNVNCAHPGQNLRLQDGGKLQTIVQNVFNETIGNGAVIVGNISATARQGQVTFTMVVSAGEPKKDVLAVFTRQLQKVFDDAFGKDAVKANVTSVKMNIMKATIELSMVLVHENKWSQSLRKIESVSTTRGIWNFINAEVDLTKREVFTSDDTITITVAGVNGVQKGDSLDSGGEEKFKNVVQTLLDELIEEGAVKVIRVDVTGIEMNKIKIVMRLSGGEGEVEGILSKKVAAKKEVQGPTPDALALQTPKVICGWVSFLIVNIFGLGTVYSIYPGMAPCSITQFKYFNIIDILILILSSIGPFLIIIISQVTAWDNPKDGSGPDIRWDTPSPIWVWGVLGVTLVASQHICEIIVICMIHLPDTKISKDVTISPWRACTLTILMVSFQLASSVIGLSGVMVNSGNTMMNLSQTVTLATMLLTGVLGEGYLTELKKYEPGKWPTQGMGKWATYRWWNGRAFKNAWAIWSCICTTNLRGDIMLCRQ